MATMLFSRLALSAIQMADPLVVTTAVLSVVAQSTQGIQTAQGWFRKCQITVASAASEEYEAVLRACSLTFAVLNRRLEGLDVYGLNEKNKCSCKAKLKALWNDDEMTLPRHNIRSWCSSPLLWRVAMCDPRPKAQARMGMLLYAQHRLL
jgi:hypothetical protein